MTFTNNLKRIVSGVVVALAFFMIFVPKSYATAGIAVSPNYGAPLSQVTVYGQGFCTTCGSISILMNGSYVTQTTVDTSGMFSTMVQIPDTARPGTNTISASQIANGNTISARTNFEVIINPTQNGSAQTNSTTKPSSGPTPKQATQSSQTPPTTSGGNQSDPLGFVSNNRCLELLIILLVFSITGLIFWRYKRQNSKRIPKKKRK